MALINRITNLFRADFNAVLDQIEEPEALLKQSIRDMESSVVSTRESLQSRLSKRDLVQRSIDELKQKFQELETELDVCFESHKEDLAKNLIRRKLEFKLRAEELNSRQHELEKSIHAIQNTLNEQEDTLDSLRREAGVITDKRAADSASFEYSSLDLGSHRRAITDNDVEVAYLQESQRRANS